jgi:hypothetical protein
MKSFQDEYFLPAVMQGGCDVRPRQPGIRNPGDKDLINRGKSKKFYK